MENAFAIRNKRKEILVFTISKQRSNARSILTRIKGQCWDELQGEGYELVEVVVKVISDPWEDTYTPA